AGEVARPIRESSGSLARKAGELGRARSQLVHRRRQDLKHPVRIAWLTPYLPNPPNTGGRIRIARIAQAFAARGDELCLFSALADEDEAHDTAAPFGPWAKVHTSVRTTIRFRPLDTRPRPVRFFPTALSTAVAEENTRHPWDLVMVEHCYAQVE